ncbi:hypothetical protein [Chitinophaga vietnamensis]|uniref:hypothetical protein n=1 Tax=Chitinophaga vietnamensis TaxID=2593957 RepID=UPI00117732C1|nr:hypothetical protein [Chitinophaga vietnamensis]
MIPYKEYTDKLTKLLQIFDQSLSPAQPAEAPKSIAVLASLPSFVHTRTDKDGIYLSFYKKEQQQFLIKKADFHKEDPPLYFIKKNKPVLYFATSSIILLTELSQYLFAQSAHSLRHKGFDVYPILREHFELFCKDVDYPFKVWINDSYKSFVLVDNNEEILYFVSNNEAHKKQLEELFHFTPSAPVAAAQPVALPDDFISAPHLEGSMLKGKINILQNKTVNVTYDLETEQPAAVKDFLPLIAQSKKIIAKLSEEEQEKIKDKISKEITVAAYRQMDTKPDADQEQQHLQQELELNEILFVEKDILLYYQAKKIFKDSRILAQLNSRLSVVEVSVL